MASVMHRTRPRRRHHRRRQVSERHLFVAIDPSHYLPWKDLEYGQMPSRPPQLPEPITTAWLATTFDTLILCWTYAPNHGWQSWTFERGQVFGVSPPPGWS
jgi:hypothetical protein